MVHVVMIGGPNDGDELDFPKAPEYLRVADANKVARRRPAGYHIYEPVDDLDGGIVRYMHARHEVDEPEVRG